MWQDAQALSSACGPAGWFAPVAKSTSSWHDWHAARPGLAYQLGACVAGGAWHVVQLRMSCGKTTSEKSTTDCWKPMIW